MCNNKSNGNCRFGHLNIINAKIRNLISYIDEFQIKMNEQHQEIELMEKYFKNDNKQLETITEE